MEYLHHDLIIPLLAKKNRLPDPCPVKIKIDEKYVYLFVGPRDFQWDKETGKFIGAGTSFEPCVNHPDLSQPIVVNLPCNPNFSMPDFPADLPVCDVKYEFVDGWSNRPSDAREPIFTDLTLPTVPNTPDCLENL